jgi:hypothetical protein
LKAVHLSKHVHWTPSKADWELILYLEVERK